jgi:hypothetical protein
MIENENHQSNNIINKNILLTQLIKNQLQNVELDKKFTLSDMKRVVNNLPSSIFNDSCCIWSGYITNLNKEDKKCYISFYHNNKKIALHRLLYINYIGKLEDNEYLKYTCENKGKCCCLNHINKLHIEHTDKNNVIEEQINIIKKTNNNIVSF